MTAAPDAERVCAVCGRTVKPLAGGWVHAKGGHVAACDLDADHLATPARLRPAASYEGAVTPEDGGG